MHQFQREDLIEVIKTKERGRVIDFRLGKGQERLIQVRLRSGKAVYTVDELKLI